MKRVIFVGQAMPRMKRNPHDWPTLNKWLYGIGFDDTMLRTWTKYSALVDYFPGSINGSHIVPSREQIEAERERLRKTLMSFDPEIVVPIGKLSISYCLGEAFVTLGEHVGSRYRLVPYGLHERELMVIPLPHPSGASTWRYQSGNMDRLNKALELIKREVF